MCTICDCKSRAGVASGLVEAEKEKAPIADQSDGLQIRSAHQATNEQNRLVAMEMGGWWRSSERSGAHAGKKRSTARPLGRGVVISPSYRSSLFTSHGNSN